MIIDFGIFYQVEVSEGLHVVVSLEIGEYKIVYSV
jgi:hypothetical protein